VPGPRVYHLKPVQTALQKSSISTSVIQTLQLQQNQSGPGGSEKTYVIKYNNSTYNNSTNQGTTILQTGNHAQTGKVKGSAILLGGHTSAHTRPGVAGGQVASNTAGHRGVCRNEPYAQCKLCSRLIQLSQMSNFVCPTCQNTPGSSSTT